MPIDFKKAATFNAKRLDDKTLTLDMIATMVAERQAAHGLLVDGKCGTDTAKTFAPAPSGDGKLVCWPMLSLPDGRKPRITSGHAKQNPDRASHWGVDILYRYDAAIDEPIYKAAHGGKAIPTNDPPGGADGGAAASGGVKKWWVPDETPAVAVAPGVVVAASFIGTGGRVWIDIGGGILAGYMHLSRLDVAIGDRLRPGDNVGIVGDSTAPGNDPRHLHFELCRGRAAAGGNGVVGWPGGTIDPEPMLEAVPVRPWLF